MHRPPPHFLLLTETLTCCTRQQFHCFNVKLYLYATFDWKNPTRQTILTLILIKTAKRQQMGSIIIYCDLLAMCTEITWFEASGSRSVLLSWLFTNMRHGGGIWRTLLPPAGWGVLLHPVIRKRCSNITVQVVYVTCLSTYFHFRCHISQKLMFLHLFVRVHDLVWHLHHKCCKLNSFSCPRSAPRHSRWEVQHYSWTNWRQRHPLTVQVTWLSDSNPVLNTTQTQALEDFRKTSESKSRLILCYK